MPEPTERHHLIARLRDEIRRLERRPAARVGSVACGLEGVDGVLPGGGFPRGALSTLGGGPASGKTAVTLALFASLGPEALAAYVDGRGELYPPAAVARGVDLARLLVVRPPAQPAAGGGTAAQTRAGLWAAEALLASGAFAAVAIDVPVPRALDGADAIARRLQAAAERGGSVGLWLAPPRGMHVLAAVRIDLEADGERIVARRSGAGRAAPRDGGSHRAA